jgi:uncharacterized phage protein gp47/JayE
MAYGVTSSGFVKKPATQIKADLEAAFRARNGDSFDVSTESPAGQIIGLATDLVSEAWDMAEATYAAFSPDGATDVSLDNLCALTGTKRLPATFSTVTATLTGTPGAVISAATFSVAGTGSQFKMDADATIGGGGTVTATCTAVASGPVIATAGTLTVIDTPRAGLTSVTNATDAKLGSNIETNAALRLRREAELRASGNAALEAIRAKVLAVTDAVTGAALVSACTVFANEGDVTDGDGLPPHSVNVLANCAVGSSVDSAVAAAIFASKAAGVQTYGAASASVTDSQGIAHTVAFDRPTEVNVYVRLDLTIDALNWPADGVAQVKDAIVAYGSSVLTTGRDVVSSAVAAQAFKVPGVLDTGLAKLGTAPSPTLTSNIAITTRQLAKLDTSRITVNTTPGTP